MKKNSSIYEIAAEVGVHPSTVSRALNGKDGVRADLKAKILRVAETKNYHPDALWVAGRADYKNVGVFISRQSTPTAVGQFYYDVLQGIRMELSEHGYNLLLSEIPEEGSHASYHDFCEENNVIGAIFVGSQALQVCEPSSMPRVLVDATAEGLEIDCIVSDNSGGVIKGTNYLIEKGHTSIGFVVARLDLPSIMMRQMGYEAVMKQAGMETIVFNADRLDMESGRSIARQIVDADPRPTALMVANDELAIGVLNGLQEAGLDIPGDIAVIGFDNIQWSAFVRPALTTVGVDRIHMGRIAVQQMVNQIVHREYIHTISMVYTELVVRDSA